MISYVPTQATETNRFPHEPDRLHVVHKELLGEISTAVTPCDISSYHLSGIHTSPTALFFCYRVFCAAVSGH
jgi:hypothetical protein